MIKEKLAEQPAKTVTWGMMAAVLVTVGVYFMGQVFGYLAVSIIPTGMGWSQDRIVNWLEQSTIAQFWTVLAVEVATLGLLYSFLKIRKATLRMLGLVKPQVKDLLYALVGYGVYFAGYIVVLTIAMQLFPSLDVEQEQQIGFEEARGSFELILTFVSLVVLPPIAEEIVIRGFLYSGLRKELPKWPAAVMTSVIFAIAHLQFGSDAPLLWVAAIDTFVLSMVLVHLREKTGSLWPCIALHALKNGVAFLALFVFVSR